MAAPDWKVGREAAADAGEKDDSAVEWVDWGKGGAVALAPYSCGMSRRAVECSGYTCCHLPDGKWKPD